MGMNGDEAVAYAIKQVNPEVVAAYPITPQTIIVERLSEYVADGVVDTEFVAVESEHSALSSCVGTAAVGARAFTATASNGLALMWEILYIASGLRLPIVMAIANRALSGPINIHCDHSDSMGARDSGWIQIYCENSQEVYDASIEAWRIGEHPDVQLPVMICLDGFTLSHTMENVLTLPDETVKRFVGDRQFIRVKGHIGDTDLYLHPDSPLTMGVASLREYYFEHKMHQVKAMEEALKVIPEIDREYAKVSGQAYKFLHPYRIEDAEMALIGLGSTMGTARVVVNRLRNKGIKAGLVNMRVFRPFPSENILNLLKDIPIVGVLDKAISYGAPGGPLYEELKTVFYDRADRPLMVNYIHGLGGRDTSPQLILEIFNDLKDNLKKGKAPKKMRFMGVRE
jgi:pyruvate ferredoxin oxidoreductase alpha subunit